MHRLARLVCLALPLSLAWAAEDRGPGYLDLRLSGGVDGSSSGQVAFGVVCGDFSEEYEGNWLGMVIGGRLYASSGWRLEGKGQSDKTRIDLAGGQALGGLGLTMGRRNHLELLVIYGGGIWGNHVRSADATLVGHYKQIGGELGWYHTFQRGVQIGATVGYSVVDAQLDNGPGPATYNGDGYAAALSIGRRF